MKIVTAMETMKSSLSSSPSSSTIEIMQQQQQQDSNIKSLDLQCDEEFDETLAERPSTSYHHSHHHYHQQQEQQHRQERRKLEQQQQLGQQQQLEQQPQRHHSTDNHKSIRNDEAIDNCAVVDSPLFNKMKRQWRNYGWYTSCEEMDEVRRREKVSKRKSVTSIHGTKVFYRCNNWRRTRCNFRMYAIIFASDKMCLFASGEHDHTAKDPCYVTEISPRK
ncbi:unnamed protein product [Onchocerca ochengi]|uniref:FLYWCH-type domain-containing protein n=1 Tax=Onchocerca ochengi TaxID=42157 RepID=A0A182ERJ6_ONCOC|nr:unnamed protein product [Onchocerca ochengi]